jgi:hypothetical protein
MWTFNDFSMYKMVYDWSTHGELACLCYMENNNTFTLTNGGRASFLDRHQRFLPTNHKYIQNRDDFFVDRVEKDIVSLIPLVHNVVS